MEVVLFGTQHRKDSELRKSGIMQVKNHQNNSQLRRMGSYVKRKMGTTMTTEKLILKAENPMQWVILQIRYVYIT